LAILSRKNGTTWDRPKQLNITNLKPSLTASFDVHIISFYCMSQHIFSSVIIIEDMDTENT